MLNSRQIKKERDLKFPDSCMAELKRRIGALWVVLLIPYFLKQGDTEASGIKEERKLKYNRLCLPL